MLGFRIKNLSLVSETVISKEAILFLFPLHSVCFVYPISLQYFLQCWIPVIFG